ncbi:MAG: UDP-N-acetylglucosamine 1-carboxyvinyltransferase [Puniceicoccales bacterium]|jgi:UDP-N-acetylglucosamine 1-carboxyvinyltransferase|nr:UDP-N-acetylglucosamine 1-carboxyvinyltransferase [Puniceicoccales bacterium]
MDVVRITGNKPLSGTVNVSGAKNAVLPMLAATLLTAESCVLRNVPQLSDVHFMLEILRHHGAQVEKLAPGTWRITAACVHGRTPYDLVRKMRASICLLGALVGRLRMVEIALPGGCVIGPRPIDLHLKGLTRLNCEVSHKNGYISVDATRARGNYIFMGGRHGSTVTGTTNLLMAAVLTPGITHIDCAACEPEVVDLCRMLLAMGAKIEGLGSPALIVTGVERLHGCDHTPLADRIEAGTYLLAGAITQGDITVQGASAEHLGAFLDKLDEAGVAIEALGTQTLRVHGGLSRCRPVDIITHPHPGFATDLQAQFSTLLTLIPGLSLITERIYPNRFMHVPELQRMGADIAIEGATAIVKGGVKLCGAPIMASDLRASAALILAGLVASGETWVRRIYHLDRGYECFDKRLAALGADITRMDDREIPGDLHEE